MRIERKAVRRAFEAFPTVEVAASHLDLEGFAYFKVVRSGPNECFVQDVTQRVLTHDSEDVGKPMTIAEIERTFWRKPAYLKWGKKA